VNLSVYNAPGVWGSVSKQEWKDCNKDSGSLVAIDFAVVPFHLVTVTVQLVMNIKKYSEYIFSGIFYMISQTVINTLICNS
jgi:hypothetical protein